MSTATNSWTLQCSSCRTDAQVERATTCATCGQPLFANYSVDGGNATFIDRCDAWRYRALLPIREHELPVTLGEGRTPLIESPSLARHVGVRRLYIKDESQNPTGSFKARGMTAVVTRAKHDGSPGLVVPTAGNAGAALAAYGAAAGIPVQVFAPATTPKPILDTIEAMGATLVRIDGHIGDAGKLANAFAAEHGFFAVSTLREPYRVEGMKTMGFELAEQLGGVLPDVVVYPTGGGEGTIGIWKAFNELAGLGMLAAQNRQPRYLISQAEGCAPLVSAFDAGEAAASPWMNPVTYAAGLRVPAPFGDRLLLRILRETNGLALSVSEARIRDETKRLATTTGIDAAPEGGCALAALHDAVKSEKVAADSTVVIFNTGAGASYRS